MEIAPIRQRPIGDLEMPRPPAGMAERWGFSRRHAHLAASAAIAIASLIAPNEARALTASAAPQGIEHSIAGDAFRSDADFYVLGETHGRLDQKLDIEAALTAAHAKGVRVLAVEVPESMQPVCDQFNAGKMNLKHLSSELWGRSLEDLPKSYQIGMETMQAAHKLGWQIVAIDGTEDTFWRMGTAERIAGIEPRMRDPEAQRVVTEKGMDPAISGDQGTASIEAWRDLIDNRTRDMAAAMAAARERTGSKVLAVVGLTHASPMADLANGSLHRELLPILNMKGIDDWLPAGRTQTIIYLGGQTEVRGVHPGKLETYVAENLKGAGLVQIAIGSKNEEFAMVGNP